MFNPHDVGLMFIARAVTEEQACAQPCARPCAKLYAQPCAEPYANAKPCGPTCAPPYAEPCAPTGAQPGAAEFATSPAGKSQWFSAKKVFST